jgi:AcrR family transcriptional regulator
VKQEGNRRRQQTREQIRSAAHRLFLRQGYLATSIEAILSEAGISSRETFYRYYPSKEDLFADVLSHLTVNQPHFVATLTELPVVYDLPSLREALTQLSREILTVASQPDYLPLVRMVLTEGQRFPQLGGLFFSTVTQRGLTIITSLLRSASEQRIVAPLDVDVVARTLLGGLLSYVIPNLALPEEVIEPAKLDRADAVVEVIMRALTP